MRRLESYLPPFARRPVAGRTALAPSLSNGLHGAVFVADIAGFTALTELKARAGPAGIEEMQAILNRCFERVVGVIEEGGGEVYKFAGDATIACWFAEASQTREAVLAAASTALRLQALVPELERAARVPLQLRIGIGAGELWTAVLGGVQGRWEAVLGGAALAQVAAAEAAPAGQVVVSAEAFAAIEADCSGRQLAGGTVAIDGVTPPMPAAPEPPPPAADEAMVVPFVPRHVVERLRASPHGWLAELRFASVLFASVEAGADLAALQASVEAMQRSVYACGGSVAQCLIDDKGKLVLVAAWGIAGSSRSNDAERAVRAAHGMHAALRDAGAEVSVGVASGRLFAGMRGAPSRSEFALIGAAINLAARLAQAAAGKLWCDEATARAVDAIDFAALPAVELKGIGSVAVFEPQGRRRRAGVAARAIVGRDAELARLEEALRSVGAEPDRNVVVLIEGEPGIGKSRLCDAFAASARAAGVTVAIGASEPLGGTGAYRPLRAVLDSLFGLEDLEPADRRGRVLSLIGDDDWRRERAGLLADVLELAIEETPTTLAMSGRARLEATAELLAQLAAAASDAAPSRVVVLEDVHWLDSPSWAVVEQLALHLSGLLLVLVARPLAEHPLAARAMALAPATVRIRLAALAETAVRELALQQLGVEAVPDALLRLLGERTQGMPLFVRQVLGALLDRGIVRVEAGVAHCDEAALAAFVVPDTIQGAVISRIDRLSPRQQGTLKKASVVGPTFTIEALASADAGDVSTEELREDIEAMRERGLVAAGEQAGEFSFSHALVREAVYGLLPLQRRRELHAALGIWYERRAGDDPAMLGRIAEHQVRAHDPVRAPAALERAGRHALRAGAYREAQGWFRRLVEIAEQGFGDGDETRVAATRDDLARWQLRLGQASYDTGDLPVSRRALEAAARLLDGALPSQRALAPRLALEVGRVFWHGLLPRPRSLAPVSQRQRELARVLAMLARIYHLSQLQNHTLFTMLRRFNLLERREPVPELMAALAGLMYITTMLGRYRLGDRYAGRIVEIHRRLQQPLQYAEANYIVALGYMIQTRWEDCERTAAESEQIVARLGERALRMSIAAVLGNAAELRGELQRSWQLWSSLLALAEDSGDQLNKCWATGGLAMVAVRQGRFDVAREMAGTAAAIARTIGESVSYLSNRGTLAICALEADDLAGARALIDEGVALIARQPRFATAHHQLFGLETFSEAILLLWEREAPAAGSAAWKQHASRAALVVARLRGYARSFAIGAPAAANREALRHWLHGRHSRAIAAWHRAIAAAERARMPYECAKAHVEMARHLPPGTERRQHAEAGAAIFARIGGVAPSRRPSAPEPAEKPRSEAAA